MLNFSWKYSQLLNNILRAVEWIIQSLLRDARICSQTLDFRFLINSVENFGSIANTF